jgi:hypothetical protein
MHKSHSSVLKSHSACRNLTLRIKITLVCVSVTLMSVVITSYVSKSHSACWKLNQTHECRIHTIRVKITLVSAGITIGLVKITLCLWESPSAHSVCKNHSSKCLKSHSAWGKISLCVSKSHLWVYILHFACINHTRACWNITLRVKITVVSV